MTPDPRQTAERIIRVLLCGEDDLSKVQILLGEDDLKSLRTEIEAALTASAQEISDTCHFCGTVRTGQWALLFYEPDDESRCVKRHVCPTCLTKIKCLDVLTTALTVARGALENIARPLTDSDSLTDDIGQSIGVIVRRDIAKEALAALPPEGTPCALPVMCRATCGRSSRS